MLKFEIRLANQAEANEMIDNNFAERLIKSFLFRPITSQIHIIVPSFVFENE